MSYHPHPVAHAPHSYSHSFPTLHPVQAPGHSQTRHVSTHGASHGSKEKRSRRGGRTVGSQNFGMEEIKELLRVVRAVLPIGPSGWLKVGNDYEAWVRTQSNVSSRDVKTLKDKYNRLVREAREKPEAAGPRSEILKNALGIDELIEAKLASPDARDALNETPTPAQEAVGPEDAEPDTEEDPIEERQERGVVPGVTGGQPITSRSPIVDDARSSASASPPPRLPPLQHMAHPPPLSSGPQAFPPFMTYYNPSPYWDPHTAQPPYTPSFNQGHIPPPPPTTAPPPPPPPHFSTGFSSAQITTLQNENRELRARIDHLTASLMHEMQRVHAVERAKDKMESKATMYRTLYESQLATRCRGCCHCHHYSYDRDQDQDQERDQDHGHGHGHGHGHRHRHKYDRGHEHDRDRGHRRCTSRANSAEPAPKRQKSRHSPGHGLRSEEGEGEGEHVQAKEQEREQGQSGAPPSQEGQRHSEGHSGDSADVDGPSSNTLLEYP
ncbi:hypothetical protein AX16_004071 [Volvariella volvacea WC 439]|nr:hypothetical protein AX16_004071 [Volvariella volvacea WC 439]